MRVRGCVWSHISIPIVRPEREADGEKQHDDHRTEQVRVLQCLKGARRQSAGGLGGAERAQLDQIVQQH